VLEAHFLPRKEVTKAIKAALFEMKRTQRVGADDSKPARKEKPKCGKKPAANKTRKSKKSLK
jgi:hypothetical protein